MINRIIRLAVALALCLAAATPAWADYSYSGNSKHSKHSDDSRHSDASSESDNSDNADRSYSPARSDHSDNSADSDEFEHSDNSYNTVSPADSANDDDALIGLYVGLSGIRFDQRMTVPGISDKARTGGAMVRLGYDVYKYWGLEARFGLMDTATFSRIGASQDGHFSSFLVKGKLPLGDYIRVYALMGLSNFQMTASGTVTGSINKDALSYGAGLQIHGRHWGGSVEWMRYWDHVIAGPGIEVSIDGIAATVGYTF